MLFQYYPNLTLSTEGHPFCVVDVGLLDTGDWGVVEVNPPFALSSYDWDVGAYYAYCAAAWRSVVEAAYPESA